MALVFFYLSIYLGLSVKLKHHSALELFHCGVMEGHQSGRNCYMSIFGLFSFYYLHFCFYALFDLLPLGRKPGRVIPYVVDLIGTI